MKKMLIFIAAFALFCTLGGSVLADSEYANAMALYNSWYVEKDVDGQKVFEQEYPEAVCGVWSTDGGTDNLTVAVTDDEAGERAKEEILASVADDSTLSFTTQKYPHSELKRVHSLISDYLQSYEGEETGVAGWGIYEMRNRVHVDIIVSKPGAEDFMRWGYENFGDMILFESVDGYAVPSAEELGLGGENGGGIGGAVTAAAAVVIIVCAVLAARKFFFGKNKEEKAE